MTRATTATAGKSKAAAVKKPRTKKPEEPAEVVHGFKGFNKNFQCLGYQYAVGQTFEHDGAVRLCSSGFHCIDGNPLDVLDFYPLIAYDGSLNRFGSVVASGEITRDGSSKIVSAKLTIAAELKLPDLVAAAIKFVTAACKTKETAASGDSSKLAASGDYSQLAASGDSSQLAASGDSSQLAASGYYSKLAASGYSSQLAASGYSSQLAASGDRSKLAASGDRSKLAASGYYSKLAASGYYSKLAASGDSSQLAASGDSSQLAASGYSSQLAASGDRSQLAASGDSSKLAASGKDSVIAAASPGCVAKGADGTWISLAEFNRNGKCVGFAVGQIGKDGLKPDTAHMAKNGKLVEAA